MDHDNLESPSERVHTIVVDQYEHLESGVKLKLRDMSLYLLNEEDFAIKPADFEPARHEHAIPKFEMARIYILLCAITGDKLGFRPSDRADDPVYAIYEKAYRKLVRTERDRSLFLGIARVGQESGFLTEGQEAEGHGKTLGV